MDIRLAPCLAAAVVLCGCLPWPHAEPRAPRIVGTVMNGEVPAAGAKVLFFPRCSPASSDPCDGSHRKASTDGRGQFSFKAESDFKLFATLGERVNCWAVCVEQDGKRLAGLRQSHPGPPRGYVQLQCDLASAPAAPAGNALPKAVRDGGPSGPDAAPAGICACSTCGPDPIK